jgi:hypothetical protein
MHGEQDADDEGWHALDRALCEAQAAFSFQTLTSPLALDAAWARFQQTDCEEPPALRLPAPGFNPGELHERVAALDLAGVEDPDLHCLLAGQQAELAWQLTMLQLRDSPAFLPRSMLRYGPVSQELHGIARLILEELPLGAGSDDDPEPADAGQPAVPQRRTLPVFRPEDRLQQVDTRAAMDYNGEAQPLRLLATGLPDCDGVQEALEVMAEYLADRLSSTRLRTLAARVTAVHALEDGAGFIDSFRLLHEDHDLDPRAAFDLTARTFAGGGLTRDQIHLQGLLWLLRFLAADGDLAGLYMGRMGTAQVPAVLRLAQRGFLEQPRVLPALLEGPGAEAKLEALGGGLSPLDLVADRD